MPTLFLLLQYNSNNNNDKKRNLQTVIAVIVAIIGSALCISYIVDYGLDGTLADKMSLLVNDKESSGEMAELPTWYVNMVPYLTSSMICTGCIRYFASKYGKSATSKTTIVVDETNVKSKIE